MVAIRLPQTDPGDWSYAPGHPRPSRPLRPVAPPGPDRATRYRRRRLAALVLATSAVLGLVAAVGYLTSLAGPDGTPAPIDAGPARQGGSASGAASGAGATAEGEAYVVQPGDTLWSIAAELAPGDDPRPIVDRLRAANGGGTLEAGDRLVLDAG